jgi:hypothetical protein
MMIFKCQTKFNQKTEIWFSEIKYLKKYTHYEIFIDSRSSIRAIYGQISQDSSLCLPDYGVGCRLVDIDDKFWNLEKISSLVGKVDGITVYNALLYLNKNILQNEKDLVKDV